jgi:MFS family permease
MSGLVASSLAAGTPKLANATVMTANDVGSGAARTLYARLSRLSRSRRSPDAWVPSFLVKQGLSVSASLGYTTFMSLGGPVGAFLGFLLSDRLGRKRGIVIVSLVAAGLGTAYANAPALWVATLIGFALFTCIYILVAFVIAV